MPIYRVADIAFEANAKYSMFKKRLEKYTAQDAEPLFKIEVRDEELQNVHVTEEFTYEIAEYMLTGKQFYMNLLKNNGIMLHASGIKYKGGAYLFSADSGTGKSTHTGIWQRVFGKDNVKILNDDKPAIRFFGDEIFAYGTPWSGKYDISLNEKVPLKAIVFLERGAENIIRRTNDKEAFEMFFQQTVRRIDAEYMSCLFDVMDKVLKLVPIYKMSCNMEDEAAIIAEKTICSSDIL